MPKTITQEMSRLDEIADAFLDDNDVWVALDGYVRGHVSDSEIQQRLKYLKMASEGRVDERVYEDDGRELSAKEERDSA